MAGLPVLRRDRIFEPTKKIIYYFQSEAHSSLLKRILLSDTEPFFLSHQLIIAFYKISVFFTLILFWNAFHAP